MADVERAKPFAGKTVLITGGSRDIGAGIVRQLAERGADLVIGFNNKAKRADSVAKQLEGTSSNFEFVQSDITTKEGVTALTNAVDRISPQERAGQIDLLILNAASNTRAVNVEANQALIDAALPRMKPGGKIAFMQSGPGRFNSVLKPVGLVPDVYTPVADSKDEGDRAIEARLPEMKAQGIDLVRLVAPAIPDSTNVRMFKSRDAEAAGRFDQISQKLGIPEVMSVDEVSKNVVDVLESKTGPDHLELFGPYLDGRHVLRRVYGELAIYVDVVNTAEGVGRMIVTPERASRKNEMLLVDGGTMPTEAAMDLPITEAHAEGHFSKESGLPLVLPGHKGIRMAADAVGQIADLLTLSEQQIESGEVSYVRVKGFEGAQFIKPIKPGQYATVEAKLISREGNSFLADASIYVGTELKTEIKGLEVEKTERPEKDPILEDQIIEFAAQSAATEVLTDPNKMPMFAGIGRARFTGLDITPGTALMAIEQNTTSEGRNFRGSSTIADEHGNLVAEIEDMQGIITSSKFVRLALNRS